MDVFMFPGQGAQTRGMGADLFDEVPEYAAVEREVDALLGYSMRELCLEDPHGRLGYTQYTQPALYVVNALHYYKMLGSGRRPAYVLGHSLGEYSALLAAGVFDLLTGLELVRKRGELMGRPRAVETMVAVIGLDSACIEEVIRENGLSAIDVANFNSPSQTVVSGPSAELERAGPIFERAGASAYVPLPVSAAFHSRYMADAGRAFADFLAPMTFRRPEVPVIANVTGRLYGDDDTSETVRSLLTRQITHPVQWLQSVRYVLAQGSMEFVEVGPRNVLTPLVQQIRRTMDAASR